MQKRPTTPGRIFYRVVVSLIPPLLLHIVALRLWYSSKAKTYLGETWFSFYDRAKFWDWVNYHVGAMAYLLAYIGALAVAVLYLWKAWRFIKTGRLLPPSDDEV